VQHFERTGQLARDHETIVAHARLFLRPFFRQKPHCLREEPERRDLDREFLCLCLE